MPSGLFLTTWTDNAPDLFLEAGEDLTYVDGTVWVYNDALELVEADNLRGGWSVASDVPPPEPELAFVWLRSTQAMLETLSDRMYASDERLGLWGEIVADA